MNNDAFRALINKQRSSSAAEKSTKEIAREAVEDEFQKKRRRGGGGGGGRRGRGFDDGYGSDSGGSSDEDAGGKLRERGKDSTAEHPVDDEPDWKKRRREKKLQDGELEYRDRAKERREGNNLDYSSMERLTQLGEEDRRRQAELSKYLGGDEEHTHLVKGLDKALAEKVRREEMGQQTGESKDGDLDQLLEDSYALKHQKASHRPAQPKTELGKSVWSYLLEKKKSTAPFTTSQHKSNPTIHKSLQRSILTFSLESDVRQRKNAWEVPRMSVRAFGTHDSGTTSRKMTPLNHHLIATISKKLDEGTSRVKEKSKYQTCPSDEDTHGTICNGVSASGKDQGRDNQNGLAANSIKNCKANVGNREDSDDDIFQDVGSYVPHILPPPETSDLAASMSTDIVPGNDNRSNSAGENDSSIGKQKDNAASPKEAKQSIFDNLIPETSPAAPKCVLRPQLQNCPITTKQQKPSSQNKNVIDRDIFGGQQDLTHPYQKRRGPQSAAMEGVSMTSYQGGYGEEMDVDFGGDDNEWRKGKGDKEKGTTSDTGGDQDVDEEEG
mmetsp:Transcript_32596/g.78948  ORF Transcript_32596/g.78948 Transcript_32596/m.78948 type:complete len:553 (+) Transcript_32596:40-1698(+)